jgi:Ion transport protein
MDMIMILLIAIAEGLTGGFSHPDSTDTKKYESLSKVVRTLYSFAAIIIWVRFLYFFRIFRTTGYYIRMLMNVAADLRYFVFIFVLTIFAMAHAYFIFLKNGQNMGDDNVGFTHVTDALAYVYNIPLGNLDTSNYGTYYP